jgi:hypothetical protein
MAEQKLIEREWIPLFTPGFDTDILADTTPQQLVARVLAYDRDVANLIAAAPELLRALQAMCDTFGLMFDNNPPPDEFESDAQARTIVESARSVLAQAKGQSK